MTDSAVFSKNVDDTYRRLRGGLTKNLRSYDWRMKQLRALKKLLEENDDAISHAMWKDLRKSKFECAATEQGIVLAEIADALRNLKDWMEVRHVETPLYNLPGKSYIVYEPYGLTLIIGAWNYPINLTLAPLVGAIAGGNGAIIKPSEMSMQTAAIIADLVPKYLDPDLFAVIQGGAEETGILLDQKFDMIFFTGSGPVGKIILQKAATNLTPVTLELGGKSPAVVMKDADIKVTAKRIAWGKFMNAGQTCIAPDYLIVCSELKDKLVTEIKKHLIEFFGSDPKGSPDYCRIINSKNFDRLAKLYEGLTILHGGENDRDQLFIAPTLVDASSDSPIMQEEIFGPILPVLQIDNLQSIIDFINQRPKPLALYVFTKSEKNIEKFTNGTSSGALCFNEVVMHMPVPELPFGGVGASGMGHYHGRFSFETFSHAKGILKKTFWFDLPARYAPYTKFKAKLLRWLFS